MKNDFVALSQKIKRKEMNKLTGHKDLESQVMEFMDDRTLFNLLQTHPEYLKKVQRLAEKRVKDKYPTLVKWKDENETWFHYYASIVYYLSL